MECNTCLPLDQLVKVDINIEDIVQQQEFNCLAILTSRANCGVGLTPSVVNASNQVEEYVTFADLAAEWDSSCEVYQAAQHAFAQTPRVGVIKVMHVSRFNGPSLTEQLTDLFRCENCQGIVAPEIRGDNAEGKAMVLEIADWVESTGCNHCYFTDTSDPLTLDPNDTTSIAAMIQAAAYECTAAYYHSDPDEQFAAAALSYGLGQDLDQVGSAFAMAYQELALVNPDFLTPSEVAAATGFLGSVGCGANIGKFANVYTCYGSTTAQGIFYGTMGDGNHFDTKLLREYMTARIQERMANLLIGNTTALTDGGINRAAAELEFMLSQYQQAGFIDDYVVEIPDIEGSTSADRMCRIVDCFRFTARLAGRAQYFCVNGQLTF